MKKNLALYLFSIILLTDYSFAQDVYEPNNDSSNPATISCGNFYEAFIQNIGDVDWYSIQVNQSGALSVALTLVPTTLDLNLEIYQFVNNQLKLIADDDDDNRVVPK